MAAWIGTSGWSYDHWHPELYPPGLPARDRLARYTHAFTTAELNSSFCRWPAPAAFAELPQATLAGVKTLRPVRNSFLYPERSPVMPAARAQGHMT